MAHPVAASLPHAARSARPRRADARARRSHPRSPPPRAVAGGDAVAAAEAWLALDADADTRAEIQSLVDAGDDATLAARLDPSARLEFGTAGLRGEMGAGYDRMNDLVVLQTTQGLCDYLLAEEGEASAKARGVLVGYDARRKSEQFARTAASVFASRGVRVHLFKVRSDRLHALPSETDRTIPSSWWKPPARFLPSRRRRASSSSSERSLSRFREKLTIALKKKFLSRPSVFVARTPCPLPWSPSG